MKSILLRDWEVRAILDGRLSMLWRPASFERVGHVWPQADGTAKVELVAGGCGAGFRTVKCPLLGTLIGKEAWCAPSAVHGSDDPVLPGMRILYRADGVIGQAWRSSSQMPTWASRITLQVESVAVRLVQSITEEEARLCGGLSRSEFDVIRLEEDFHSGGLHWGRDRFATLWDERYGDARESLWMSNPWTWALTVRRA